MSRGARSTREMIEANIKERLATRYDRFAGAFLDMLILSIIVVPTMLALGIFQKEMNGEPLERWMEIFQLGFG